MLELTSLEIQSVSGGFDNLSAQGAVSVVSGSLIGGSVGTVIALNMMMPITALFPVWVAACVGASTTMGALMGVAYAMGSHCSK